MADNSEAHGHKCRVQETGVCGVHDTTIERRSLELKAIKKDVAVIPRLLTLANRALGAFGFLSLILTAMTIYIRDVKTEHIIDRNAHHEEMTRVAEEVAILQLETARNEGKYLLALQQIGSLSKTMERILDQQKANK